MALDLAPIMGSEGEIMMGGETIFLPIEGELGLHIVTMGAPMATEAELLAHLFTLAAVMPELIAQAKIPEGMRFVHITHEQIEIIGKIEIMLKELQEPEGRQHAEAKPTAGPDVSKSAHRPEVHRSLFSLASTMNSATAKRTDPVAKVSQPTTVEVAPPMTATSRPQKVGHSLRVEEREGGGEKRDQQEEQKRRKDQGAIKKIDNKTSATDEPQPSYLGSVGNIYIRFMALMARILGQAEAEAHQLYIKIKDRTDQIDTLSLLMAKINNSPKEIDWTQDPKMQELVNRAREIGVDIPADKYKWAESEKHLLKENLQMRKDGMEKITQLERTDMQRYLQEASQCHQARSNVLKLLKEVIDTIIYNMRP